MKTMVKSCWVKPYEYEQGAPEQRIIHGKCFVFDSPQTGFSIGFRLARGYFKCGSEETIDWVEEAEIHGFSHSRWEVIHRVKDQKKPGNGEISWFRMDGSYSAIQVSVRKSGVDGWWSCYNLADTAVVLDGLNETGQTRPIRRLHTVIGDADCDALNKDGITCIRTSVGVRYTTHFYSIGYKLKSMGLSFLSCDGEGCSQTHINLLNTASLMTGGNCDYHAQGFVVSMYDDKSGCGFMQYDAEGETVLSGNTITYRLCHKASAQYIELKATMLTDRILLFVKRDIKADTELLDSSVLRLSFLGAKTTMTVLGEIIKSGETGRVSLPATMHMPGISNITVKGDSNASLRFNSIRSMGLQNLDILVGEEPMENGGYLLKTGEYSANIELCFNLEHHVKLREDTPEHVKRALSKYLLSALTYRADVATFTNNGNSMGAPICLSCWASVCRVLGNGVNGINTMEFLRNTLEIHLFGAPAYAAGTHQSGTHQFEDEYLMTGTAVLYGISVYLNLTGDKEWFLRFKDVILKKLDDMKKRDIDDDGIVESTIRRGISGEHQWSTCWYDVISYGYKDAFSNAILFGALKELTDAFKRLGEEQLYQDMSLWLHKLKSAFISCFMTANNWFAGWRSMDGALHDYAFLPVNGLAVKYGIVEGELARRIVSSLYNELIKSGYESFDLGLPGNIYEISECDLAPFQRFLPFGGYQNGGITLSQSEAFISALYMVSMVEEADMIVSEISKGLLYGNLVSGSSGGVDWKAWDGTSCGYEGILTDQFGIFEPILTRYKV